MAYIFPLSLSDFFLRLPVRESRFACPPQKSVTGLGGGEILTSEVAPALWQGSVQLAPMRPNMAAEFEAMIEALQVPGRTFYACRTTQIGPKSDPEGNVISGLSVEMFSVSISSNQLRLQNLPSGFTLSQGDLFSFDYGSGPVRRALHRVGETVTANSAGDTPSFTPVPALRPGATNGTSVTLIRPACKAVLMPGSVDLGSSSTGDITTGVTFGFRQTLR